jgi:hypothetical protein
MPPRKFNSLALQTMASGHLCLNLTGRVSWEAFPSFADDFVGSIAGKITNKSDAPDLRIWEVRVDNTVLRLVFDDYPVMVSLESSDIQSDELLKRLHQQLNEK